MQARMRSHQPAMNTTGAGLPVCLSGIGIHPRVLLFERLGEMTLNEVSLRYHILQERPRHALALQMADLDRRREEIRKHRSNRNRGLVNSMDEQSTFLQRHSHRMMCSTMQNPAEPLEQNSCAKAA